jgi:hypothetical protein
VSPLPSTDSEDRIPRKVKLTPAELTYRWLRERGFWFQKVEQWIPQAKVRRDLFGFIDIEALHPLGVRLGIQVTDYSNMSHRRAKILETPEIREKLYAWLLGGSLFYLIGWKKKMGKWEIRLETASLGGSAEIKFCLTKDLPCFDIEATTGG